MWSLASTTLQVRLRVQLNSILFAKTLVRKDIASSTASAPTKDTANGENQAATPTGENGEKKEEENEFASKAQIMTLMTTDVDRVSEFAYHVFTLVGMLSFSTSDMN